MLRRRCVRAPPAAHARVNALSRVDDLQLDLAEGEAPVGVWQQRARQQVRLAEHLEAVADPQHQPAVAGELDHRLHHRRRSARSPPRAGSRRRRSRRARRSRRRPSGRARRATAAPRRPRDGRPRSASTSSQRAGELEDAELHSLRVGASARRAAGPRTPRPAGWRAASRTSTAAAPGPRRRARPGGRRARSPRPRSPSAGSARSTASPCGSRMPAFGRISTRARITRRVRSGRATPGRARR